MPYMKTYKYDPVANLNGPITDQFIVGSVKFAARPNTQSSKYLALVSDQGEIRVFYKDGSFVWGFNSGIVSDELSVNNNGEVLLRAGTTIKMYDSAGGGRLKWTQTIANLKKAKIKDSWVICIINTGVAATSGIQWRKLTDGTIDQDVYGTAQIMIIHEILDSNSAGTIVLLGYKRAANEAIRVEKHSKGIGRLWSTAYGTDAWNSTLDYSDISCNYDVSVNAVLAYRLTNQIGRAFLIDGDGVELGTVGTVATADFTNCKINQVGDRSIFWKKNTTSAKRVITSPFSSSAMTVGNNICNTVDPCDISEEKIIFVAEQDGKIHVYEDSDAETVSADVPISTGVISGHIAIIRDV